jgi:hypothetical protein
VKTSMVKEPFKNKGVTPGTALYRYFNRKTSNLKFAA